MTLGQLNILMKADVYMRTPRKPKPQRGTLQDLAQIVQMAQTGRR